jgi:beta-glucanase (GH16 family)
MLTLNTTATSGTVTADWTAGAREYGRWEARVRTRQYGTSETPYRAVWELVPTTGDQCSRSIILSDSTIGQNPATLHVRNTDVDFSATKMLDLRQDVFHTYAVEVTPDHISWFIDTRVVMTELRSTARTGASYAVRFRMVAPAGVVMNKGRMQMDWVRYYTLERKNAQSISAPQAILGRYDGSC